MSVIAMPLTHTVLIFLQGALEHFETTFLLGLSGGLHRVEILASVTKRRLHHQERGHVFGLR